MQRSGWRLRSADECARQSASESLADAKFAIQETGNWIKNADTKSTVVAAATGVVATASASKAGSVHAAFASGKLGCGGILFAVVIIVYIFALLVTAYYLYAALSPRTQLQVQANRFAWPNVASSGGAIPDNSRATVEAEAWSQNYMLGCIASKKFGAFKGALRWFGVSFCAAILIICISAWAMSNGG